MAAFDDFIKSFEYNPETFNPDEFRAAALSHYEADITHVNDTVAEKDAAIETLTGQTKDMGKALWEAQMRVGPPVKTDPDKPNPSGDEGNKPKDVTSFFKKVER